MSCFSCSMSRKLANPWSHEPLPLQLVRAARHGRLFDLMNLLKTATFSVDQKNEALFEAISEGHLSCVEVLVKEGGAFDKYACLHASSNRKDIIIFLELYGMSNDIIETDFASYDIIHPTTN